MLDTFFFFQGFLFWEMSVLVSGGGRQRGHIAVKTNVDGRGELERDWDRDSWSKLTRICDYYFFGRLEKSLW
jgi:hypothetical protein